MANFNSVLFYVADPAATAAFYRNILGRDPVEQSANFVGFAVEPGVMLAFWRRDEAVPKPTGTAGAELGFAAATDEAVRELHDAWKARGVTILQPPTRMEFGFTFVAADPDGYRLRPLCPAG